MKQLLLILFTIIIVGTWLSGCDNIARAEVNEPDTKVFELDLTKTMDMNSYETSSEDSDSKACKDAVQDISKNIQFASYDELYDYIEKNADLYDELLQKATESGYDNPQIFIPVAPNGTDLIGISIDLVGSYLYYIFEYEDTDETIVYSWRYISADKAENRLSNEKEGNSLQEIKGAPGYYVSDVPEETTQVAVYWLDEDKNHMFVCYLPNHKYREYFNLDSLAATTYSLFSPALCMEAIILDPNYVQPLRLYSPHFTGFSNGTYRLVRINGSVDVAVYLGRERVGAIIRDIPQRIKLGLITSINDDGEKTVYVPTDGDYTIRLTATSNGELNYSINEYNQAKNQVGRNVNYFDIPITAGQKFIGELPMYDDLDFETGAPQGSSTIYTLFNVETKQEIKADSDLLDEDARSAICRVNVIVENEEFGLVFGQGSRQLGSFAQVKAMPWQKYNFDGWYIENIKVSDELEYRFRVDADLTLVARFEEKN